MTDWRIAFPRTGGPEVLEAEDIKLSKPGRGEVLVRHDAIGLNFIDTYHRTGLYPVPLPSGLGSEASGIIEEIGNDVDDFKPGDRVAYAIGPLGSYSTARIINADLLVRIPDNISNETAAAALLKGSTAEALVERCAKARAGQTVLVHAAAGGVGSIIVQWLKALGVTVIGHVGSAQKEEQARKLGCDHVLSVPMGELANRVRELTDEKGVDIVFDGVGAASWNASVQSTKPLGLIISYGNASGPVPPIVLLDLTAAGSLFVTRPGMTHYMPDAASRRVTAARLFELIENGAIRIDIGQRFALKDAAEAHRAIESRATIGSTILLP